MPIAPGTNELSTLAKFIYATLTGDSYWNTTFTQNNDQFFEEVIPAGIQVTKPAAMFQLVHAEYIKGAFGFRLYTASIYQIKGVVEGADFSLLEDMANQIDRLFDWQNQIDNTGHPKNQQVWTDPDTGQQTMIMGMTGNRPIKFDTFIDGVNYCHLGGEYAIDYYSM